MSHTKNLSRDERYAEFKKQVEWDGWSSFTRARFDVLFPEPEARDRSITEILGMDDKAST